MYACAHYVCRKHKSEQIFSYTDISSNNSSGQGRRGRIIYGIEMKGYF